MSLTKRFLCCFFVLWSFALAAQRDREMRAVWIATVANIDWPSNKMDALEQKEELLSILDSLKSCNINTVVFQIRPTSDALYLSQLEPWSVYLTGQQGKAPSPFYDPLEFLVKEAHKRCMEVHAWFNPYRVLNSDNVSILTSDHIYYQDPKLFKWYGGKAYFNPALQDTRDYLTMIVMDVVLRYDIDAVHLDDYFYPYKVDGKEFPDDDTFAEQPRGFVSKDDWRRDNVNLVIEQLQHTIKAAKPWVQFGISPFGRFEGDFNELYADVRLWIQKGWIDYVVPQLYWALGHKTADYARLYQWWADESKGKGFDCNFYSGVYVAGTEIYSYSPWPTPNEIVRQLNYDYKQGRDKGAFFYSSHYFLHNTQGLLDSLRSNLYRYPALTPSCPNIKGQPSDAPANVKVSETNVLMWDAVPGVESDAVSFYVVYAVPDNAQVKNSPEYILTFVQNNRLDLDPFIERLPVGVRLFVTAFNRTRHESPISNVVILE